MEEIYRDCPHVNEDNDEPCDCSEKDAIAYEAECESRYDRWRDSDEDWKIEVNDGYDSL